MAVIFDGADSYNTYVQDFVPNFAFTIPVTIFFRYKYVAAETGFQPFLTVAESTTIATGATSFQIAKNDSNQLVAKSQRIGDPVGFVGSNTVTSPTVLTTNTWHRCIAYFNNVGQTIYVNSTTGTSAAWNRNDSVSLLTQLGLGGIYLFGDAEINVKPSTSNQGLHYGAGRLCDVGVMNGNPTASMIADYINNGFSCPKLYESHGGTWKYMALDTLPPGSVSAGSIPANCYGQTVTFSNYAATNGVQTAGPRYDSDWPTLSYPVTATVMPVLNAMGGAKLTHIPQARRIGV